MCASPQSDAAGSEDTEETQDRVPLRTGIGEFDSPEYRWSWLLLIALGLAARISVACCTDGFVHPDEHQQYLEVAQGIVYGPHIRFWEQEQGARHAAYPHMLAGMLFVLDGIGVSSPVAQSRAIRAIIGSIVLLCGAMLGWLRFRRDPAAGLLFAALLSLTPEWIYFNVRTLSETAMTVPFLLAMCALERERDGLAGWLLGAMFAIRFQSGFLIVGFCAALLSPVAAEGDNGWELQRRRLFRLLSGLIPSLLVVGATDRLMWGRWFHTPLYYFQRNVLEHYAASFGVSPWYQYVLDLGWRLLEGTPVLVVLALLGIRREWRAATIAFFFLAGHSVVGHKEFRFVSPLMPIGMLLIAAGFSIAMNRLRSPARRLAGTMVVAACLLLGFVLESMRIDWNPEPSRSSNFALARCRTIDDLTGVAVYGVPDWNCGNYFYLRRDVPLLLQDAPDPDGLRQKLRESRVNYLVLRREDVGLFADFQPEWRETVHELSIYRIAGRPTQMRSAADAPHSP